jgi:tetratricopeptide (TPR) repeat protein
MLCANVAEEDVVDAVDQLERGRASYARGAWTDAHELLAAADRAEDLELLATAAYMLGRDDEYVGAMERAHHLWMDAGEELRAARCAFWIGMNLSIRGEPARATGWLGRARRLVEREGRDCVEHGFLLLARMAEHEAAGDHEAAIAAGDEAVGIGERFGDADLFALAAQDLGILLIERGRVMEGLALLDEAMVAVTAGELSPIVNGFRLLRGHHGLPGRPRAATCSGMDGGSERVVRAAAGHGQLHRHLPRAQGGDHAAARRVAGRARGGAAGGAALRAGDERGRGRRSALPRG